MAIPVAQRGSVADEAALLTALGAMAATAGVTTATPATPDGTTYFVFPGMEGRNRAVVGLRDQGSGLLSTRVCSDLDTANVLAGGANVGYQRRDSAGDLVVPENENWLARGTNEPYEYRAVMSKDGCCVLLDYRTGAATRAQGLILMGRAISASGRELHRQARSRIAAVTVGSGVATITLEHDINNALIDGETQLFFQTVGGPAESFAMTERALILSGSLTLNAGRTEFDVAIDKPVGDSKLFVSAANDGRYANGLGVGDLVRLAAEPTVALCGASDTRAGTIFNGSTDSEEASWDLFGGQNDATDFYVSHPWATNSNATIADVAAPHFYSNRTDWHRAYAVFFRSSGNDDILKQPNVEGIGLLGVLPHLGFVYDNGAPGFSKFRINSDIHNTGMIMKRFASSGLAPPGNLSVSLAMMCYPGF